MTLLFWLCLPFTLIGMWLVGVTVWVTCGGQPRREPWQTKDDHLTKEKKGNRKEG